MRDFAFEYRVRVSDTDLMGVVHHGHYPRLFEWAREEYCRAAGHSFASHITRGEYLAVLHIAYRVNAQIQHDDLLRVVINVAKTTRARIWFSYQAYLDSQEKPVVTGETEHAVLSKSGKVLRVPVAFLDSKAADRES
jgi:acyl-CoA thioester hydrolase